MCVRCSVELLRHITKPSKAQETAKMCRESANQLLHLLMAAELGNSDAVKNFEQHLATQLERQRLFYLEELSQVERIQAERDAQTLGVLDSISKILEVPGIIRVSLP